MSAFILKMMTPFRYRFWGWDIWRLSMFGAPILRKSALIILFFAAWQYGSTHGWLNAAVIPPVDQIIVALWNGLTTGSLLSDISISLQRAGAAFFSAIFIGIPLGILMGRVRWLEEIFDPILQLFRQTSPLALYPVFILLMGLGEFSKIFVIFWGALFPTLIATMSGVKEVDQKLIEMAKSFGASQSIQFRRIILPAAVPAIFVGIRLTATTALLLLIASEMIGANQGVGFQIMNAQYNFQIALMYASIFVLAFLGLFINLSLVLLQKYLCRWQ